MLYKRHWVRVSQTEEELKLEKVAPFDPGSRIWYLQQTMPFNYECEIESLKNEAEEASDPNNVYEAGDLHFAVGTRRPLDLTCPF